MLEDQPAHPKSNLLKRPLSLWTFEATVVICVSGTDPLHAQRVAWKSLDCLPSYARVKSVELKEGE